MGIISSIRRIIKGRNAPDFLAAPRWIKPQPIKQSEAQKWATALPVKELFAHYHQIKEKKSLLKSSYRAAVLERINKAKSKQ
jgi:hypothetical protein